MGNRKSETEEKSRGVDSIDKVKQIERSLRLECRTCLLTLTGTLAVNFDL